MLTQTANDSRQLSFLRATVRAVDGRSKLQDLAKHRIVAFEQELLTDISEAEGNGENESRQSGGWSRTPIALPSSRPSSKSKPGAVLLSSGERRSGGGVRTCREIACLRRYAARAGHACLPQSNFRPRSSLKS